MENTASDSPISEDEARGALARLLASQSLRASRRLCRFLEHTVGAVLAGRAEELKESAIGMAVYDRPSAYEKSEDSIVRTEARRLRQKLSDYYANEGQDDPVRVHFSPGSYVPSFSRHQAARNTGATIPQPQTDEAGAGAPGEGVLVAILPFVDLSGSSLSARCTRMLTEELVHGWMHVDGVNIVSSDDIPATLTSSEALASAQRRGAQIMMTGSVWEEEERLRVTIRLVRASGLLVWSQRFEAKADSHGLRMLTDQLASALISRIRPESTEIRRQGQAVSARLFTMLPTLYEAEALLDGGIEANVHIALVKFEEILRVLPDFPRALCGVANCHCVAALHGAAGSGSLVRQAEEAAKRGNDLDPGMVLSRTTLAYSCFLGWQWQQAEACFRNALASGDHVPTFRQYALYLTAVERFDEAEFFLERAQQVDPFSGRQRLVRSLFFHFSRRGEELRSHIDDEIALGSPVAESQLLLAFNRVQEGHQEDAKRIALSCRKSVGTQPSLMASVAEILALCGDQAQARHIASVFKLHAAGSPISHYRQALLSLALGCLDDAWASLAKALADKEPELVWLKVEPRLDPMRADSQFAGFLEKVTPAHETAA